MVLSQMVGRGRHSLALATAQHFPPQVFGNGRTLRHDTVTRTSSSAKSHTFGLHRRERLQRMCRLLVFSSPQNLRSDMRTSDRTCPMEICNLQPAPIRRDGKATDVHWNKNPHNFLSGTSLGLHVVLVAVPCLDVGCHCSLG